MTAAEAMRVLKCSRNTVRYWVQKGRIRFTKMPNGRVVYWDDDVWALVGRKVIRENWTVAYVRVSGTTESHAKEMQEQKIRVANWCAKRGLKLERVYEDVCRATEWSWDKRPGLHEMMRDIIENRVICVVCESHCRMGRLGWEMFPPMFKYFGVEMEWMNTAIERPEWIQEQEEDLKYLLSRAGVERLDKLAGDLYPKLTPPYKRKKPHPGKIVPTWKDADPDLLSDLM